MFLFLIYVFVIVAVAFRSLRARHNYHSHLPEPRVVVASIRRQNTRHHPPTSQTPLGTLQVAAVRRLCLCCCRSSACSLAGWLLARLLGSFHIAFMPRSATSPHPIDIAISYYSIPYHTIPCRRLVPSVRRRTFHFTSLNFSDTKTNNVRSFVRSFVVFFFLLPLWIVRGLGLLYFKGRVLL